MKKNTIFSLIMYIAVSTVCIFFLTGAGGNENGSSGKTVITFWTDQTQTERMTQTRLLMDTFEALNPEYKVELVAVDVNDVTTQISTAASSNTLPNLITTSTQFLLSIDEEGLIDTQATQAAFDAIGKDDFFAGARNISKSIKNDGDFMVPHHFFVQGIWYRKDWFDEAGLSAPNTKDALLTAAKYFYQPDKNQYGLLIGTKAQEQYNEQNLLQIATAHNAYLFNKDGSLAIDSPEMIEAVEYYKELSQYTPPGPQTWRSRDYYLQGKLAMFFYSSFIMDDLALQEIATNSLTAENFAELEGAEFDKNLVVNTGFVPSFKWDEESSYAEIGGLSILKNDNKAAVEGAKKVIQFLFEKDSYIAYVHMVPGGMLPTLKSISQDSDFFNDPKGVYARYGKEKIQDLIAGINYPKSFLIRDGVVYPQAAVVASKLIIPDMLYEVTEENIPVQQAIADAKKKIEATLE